MPAPRVPTQRLAEALEAVARGATEAEAAQRFGVGVRTIARAKAEAKVAPKPKRVQGQPRAVQPGVKSTPPNLVEILVRELESAQQERNNPDATDAERRMWSKVIRDLVALLERVAPPAPMPPDQVAAEIRKQDGQVIELIEEYLRS